MIFKSRSAVAASLLLAVLSVISACGDAPVIDAPPPPTPVPTDAEYVVRPFYLCPADQEYFPEYRAAAERACREVQEWYREQAGVTFTLAALEVVVAGKSYAQMKYGDAPPPDDGSWPVWVDSVLAAVGGWEDRTVKCVFAQGGGGVAVGNLQDDFKGYGIFGDWVLEPISGVTNPDGVPATEATWQVEGGVPMGTTVHELAHAFGVHHPDDYEGESLMRWHGDYPAVGFLPHEVMILRGSPYFGGAMPLEDGPYPSFATQDAVRSGETLVIPGRGFEDGDEVEFVYLEARTGDEKFVAVTPSTVAPTELRVAVPTGVGPGFFRVARGKHRSHGTPLNVYPPE